jgi:hypothetical protein
MLYLVLYYDNLPGEIHFQTIWSIFLTIILFIQWILYSNLGYSQLNTLNECQSEWLYTFHPFSRLENHSALYQYQYRRKQSSLLFVEACCNEYNVHIIICLLYTGIQIRLNSENSCFLKNIGNKFPFLWALIILKGQSRI